MKYTELVILFTLKSKKTGEKKQFGLSRPLPSKVKVLQPEEEVKALPGYVKSKLEVDKNM